MVTSERVIGQVETSMRVLDINEVQKGILRVAVDELIQEYRIAVDTNLRLEAIIHKFVKDLE